MSARNSTAWSQRVRTHGVNIFSQETTTVFTREGVSRAASPAASVCTKSVLLAE